ncbi:bifunctional peptidase and arginyl-hydroxylase [Acrasis kona]|uniref:Bifunctional peptidase and arginyl-hydroxylase n=1 Tax=Acrasis kona TaxID=1008807 RepID=A0AAW2ZKY1_9EUKA
MATTTLLPGYEGTSPKNPKFFNSRNAKRDYSFLVLLMGSLLGILPSITKRIFDAETTHLANTYNAISSFVVPNKWEEYRPKSPPTVNDRVLLQHYFLSTTRKMQAINGGTQDIYYEKEYGPIVYQEGEWPTTEQFYKKSVTKAIPTLMKGYAKQFKAYQNWKTDEYIKQQIGHIPIRVETSKDNHYSGDRSKIVFTSFNFGDFLDRYSDPNRDINYYLAQTNMNTFEPLHKDFPPFPKIFGEYMKHDVTQLWFGAGGQVTPMHNDENENLLCQIYGKRIFTLIEPIFNDVLYVDTEVTNVYTRVDPLKPDYEKYPLFKQARQYQVHVEAGDCIYLPTYWYHRVESAPGRNVAINWWYMPYSNATNAMWVGVSTRNWRDPNNFDDPIKFGRKRGLQDVQ